MEKAETAGKSTLVFGVSCRQRGLKHRTAKAAPALPRDTLRDRRLRSGSCKRLSCPREPPRHDPQLIRAVPERLQTCRLPAIAHLWDSRKREEKHTWAWPLLLLETRGCKTPRVEQVGCGRGRKELQAQTHSAPALGRGAGEEQRARTLPKATEGPGPLYQPQDTTHISLAHWQHWSYFYPHWKGSTGRDKRNFWSHGGHGCSAAL